jgi:hypothetical protein
MELKYRYIYCYVATKVVAMFLCFIGQIDVMKQDCSWGNDTCYAAELIMLEWMRVGTDRRGVVISLNRDSVPLLTATFDCPE